MGQLEGGVIDSCYDGGGGVWLPWEVVIVTHGSQLKGRHGNCGGD